MANEITQSLNLTVVKGSYSRTWPSNIACNQNVQGEASGIAATTTTKSSIDIGSVTTLGWLTIQNLDPTNACDLGLDVSGTFTPFATLKPADPPCTFRVKAGITLQLKAAAGTPNIQYWLLND